MERRDETSVAALQDRLEKLTQQASRALECIEAGEVDAARRELARLLAADDAGDSGADLMADTAPQAGEDADTEARAWGAPPPPVPAEPLEFEGNVDDDELELAFAEAESDPDEMHDANRVAEQVLEDTDPDEGFEADEHPAFATRTMAQLLEGQGNVAAAQAIRSALHVRHPMADEGVGASLAESATGHSASRPSREAPAEPVGDADERPKASAHALATLERWLENVRRDVA